MFFACLAALCASAYAKTGPVYGFRPGTVDGNFGVSVVTINPVTGAVKDTGAFAQGEAQAQDLGAMDHARGIAYIVGFNQSSAKPNLVGIDVATNAVLVDVELPFTEVAFVGIGQAIDVDPASGDVLLLGQVQADAMHHEVLRCDYATKAFTTVAKLTGEAANIALLGSQASALDGGTWYMTLPVNNSAAPKQEQIEVHTYVVQLASGKVTHHKMDPAAGQLLSSMDFDAKTGKIVGFGPSEATAAAYRATNRTGGFASVEELFDFMHARGAVYAAANARAQAGYKTSAAYVHTLATMDPKTFAVAVVGKYAGYGMQEANIAALDPVGRVHLGLMQQAQPPPTTWVPSKDCGAPCGTGALCCEDPAQGEGACYKVGACADIHDGSGINTTAPFHLVQMHLDTFKLLKSPAVCSMAANDCPWSLDVADGKLTQCADTEFCCPDAKACLTPTKTSCAADAKACASGEVCCPLTKICVKPGAACQSPCAAKEYCCPDARKCLTPTNPGTFCSAAKDCKKNELCCPLTNLCVSAGASCVPAFFE